ncbi:MAG: hypothetical protein J7M18_03915 [Candidatus Eremiobacteraeota bacterium]|nr:hypothetical protein [Candidatus Eremiobacteraeota bacterium]
MKEEKPVCPRCSSEKVIPIVYGYPSQESLEMKKSGEIKFGGLKLSEDKPGWHCKDCGHEWK